MNKKFLKIADLQLINGGYLSTKEGSPVYNKEFVEAQRHAEYICLFAEKAKDKDFKGKKADSVEELRKEVNNLLNSNKTTMFISKPEAVKRPTHEKLQSEALAFINFQDSSNKVDRINNFLQQFNVIEEFSNFGLFFEEEICKLNKIYSMEEIVNAVKSVIDLLD